MAAEPVRGADRVNDELEVGYDESFEQRWNVAQNVGLVVMVLFLLVCVSGLLGRGPFSHRTVSAPDGSLRVDYEPVAREGTPTQVTLRVPNSAETPEQVSVFLSGSIAEPMGLGRTVPNAVSTMVGTQGVVLRFVVAPLQADAKIRLDALPAEVGVVRLRAWTGADGTVDLPDPRHGAHWTQVVLP